jgi:hypothetical protein
VLNPGSLARAGWHFAYNTGGSCINGLTTAYEPPAEVQNEKVSKVATFLEPETTYTVCLVSENELGEQAFGAEKTFTTSPSEPAVELEGVYPVSPFTATIIALINPERQQTSCLRFEYGETTSYGSTAPCNPPVLSEDFGDQEAGANITKLKVDHEYHFRAVVENKSSPAGGTYGPTIRSRRCR